MKTNIMCFASLLVGVFLGYLIPESEQDEDSVGNAPANTESRRSIRNANRSEVNSNDRRAGRDRVSDGDQFDESIDERELLVPASLIRELSKNQGSRKLGQELFSRDGEAEKILKITDPEKAAIQTAWRDAGVKVRELEAGSSKVEDLEDGSVLITVPDLSDTMEPLGDDFQSAVRGSLGENRGDIFLAMKGVDHVFSPPAGERTYKMAVEAVGNGRWRFHMTLDGSSGRRVWVSETVPTEIRHLTDVAKINPEMENEEIPCE